MQIFQGRYGDGKPHELHPGRMAEAARWRDEQANRLSRNFCSRLMGHVTGRRLERLLTDLRYAYRLGAEAKLRHFAQVY